MEENWKLSYSGQMAYLNAIGERIDYRRIKLPNRKVLDNVSVAEIYLKRAKKCIGKMMKCNGQKTWVSIPWRRKATRGNVGYYTVPFTEV